MTTARHYAEKVRSLVARLDEHHANAVATLCQPEVSAETCRAIQDARMTLEAELKHAAAQLASVVLAETAPRPGDVPHACANCEGTDPASCWANVTVCGAKFAGHSCGYPAGHQWRHRDFLTHQRWG